jgi:hypothetical protein
MASTYDGEKLPVVIVIPRAIPFHFPLMSGIILAYGTGGICIAFSYLIHIKFLNKVFFNYRDFYKPNHQKVFC